MYKLMRKSQNGFYSTAADVLKHQKSFKVYSNSKGLYVLEDEKGFRASFRPNEYEDAIIFYGNQKVQRDLNKG